MAGRRFAKILMALPAVLLAVGCGPRSFDAVDCYPEIFPDYVGVTVPESLAPLHFRMADGRRFNESRTRRGDTLFIKVLAWEKGAKNGTEYKEFPVYISNDPIDPYVVYRLIEPGYESWNYISLSQRELSSWKESVVVDNRANNGGCLNCHTFDAGNPDRMVFHARGKGGGTVFALGDEVHLTNLATVGPKMQVVYPAWHPGGRYICFSSNATRQSFTINHPQPIEVYDLKSDLILLDTETGEVSNPAVLGRADMLETFPSWSPDGSTLYFCSAKDAGPLPQKRGELRYSLMAIDFRDGEFVGEPRVIFASDSLSVSHPRASGDWLLFTAARFATFPIWHKEADLWLLNLRTGQAAPAAELNSPDTESWHEWSSEGRWVVFSSRRLDGRYTRLFFAHFDGEGHFGKPWLLPQKDPDSNTARLWSYNVPEFVKGPVPDKTKKISILFPR